MSLSEVRAAGLLIYRRLAQQIQYLFLQTSYGSHHWTPPKGHVDAGEDDLTAAVRETQEEAGLVAEKHYDIEQEFRRELHYTVRGKRKVVVYWLAQLNEQYCSDSSDPVVMSDEHQCYRWLPLEDAKCIAEFSDMRELLDECEAYLHRKESL